MNKGNYRLPLALTLVSAFALGGVACAVILALTIGHAELALRAPLLSFFLLVDSEGPIFAIHLALLAILLASIVIPFVKKKWSGVANVAVIVILLYWILYTAYVLLAHMT